jgi:hypothetical protein
MPDNHFSEHDGKYFEPNDEEFASILSWISEWAFAHPKRDQPFFVQMGRTLTPVQFLDEIEKRTKFGLEFLQFLFEQARRDNELPERAILRAIKANG